MKTISGRFLNFVLHFAGKPKSLIITMSVMIGVLSGLAAVLLKNAVYYVEHFVLGLRKVEELNYLNLALPAVGLMLTWLFIRFFIKEDIGHGVSKILRAISKKNGIIKRHNTYSSIAGCSLTVGFGGSAGMEAPILYTGAAIGSNIAILFRQNYRTRVLLIAAGVSGAMAAIFKAPIAGIIFAIEVLMIDMAAASVIPLIISSVTGAIVSTFLLGKQAEFYFTISDPFALTDIHWYVLLGVFCGLISFYFLYMNEKVEEFLEKIHSPVKKILFGGTLLGLLIFFFPPLLGEGYIFMKQILSGEITQITNNSFFYGLRNDIWIFALYLFLILIFKVFATSLTTGSGGVGGVFAPSLFMGGIAGAFFSRVINQLTGNNISESSFTLVGMSGLIAGVVYAPLSAIFLIAEITGGYGLFIPLIITSSLSYLTVNFFRSHSIYTKKLALKGELITHDKDKAVLTLLHVKEVIETNFVSVRFTDSLGDLVKAISKSKRNIFPVLGENNILVGIITLDDVRSIMFDKVLYDSVKVEELMSVAGETVQVTDNMEQVMDKFSGSGLWNLAVLDGSKYIGFVSRSNIFNFYREKLMEFSGNK